MNIIAIDPGVAGEGNACASFAGGALTGVWFERVAHKGKLKRRTRGSPCGAPLGGIKIDDVIIERPEFQGARTTSARPKDLMDLSFEGAMLAGAYAGRDGAQVISYTPTEWKGSEPKPVQHLRMWEDALTEDEREILGGDDTYARIVKACERGSLKRWKISGAECYPRTWTMHNVLDAVALGLVRLGRLEKTG